MADKKTVASELHVTVDAGDKMVTRAQTIAIAAINFNSRGDFHLNEVPTRVFPDTEEEKLTKEFIESSPTDFKDKIVEKDLPHAPSNAELAATPTPEMTPGPSEAIEDPILKKIEKDGKIVGEVDAN